MAVNTSLFQFQQGQWVIIDYHFNTLLQAAQNYGIIELEVMGLVCNVL